MRKPDFLIAGETKCGTTSLFEDLMKHPLVVAPFWQMVTDDYDGGEFNLAQKEIRFFDRYWYKGTDWYFKRFPDTEMFTIVGEASPTYFYRSLAMTRIKETLPGIRLIILLRNPVDRLYSHYHHIMRIAPKWSRYESFENFVESAYENDYYIIDKGIYSTSLERCYKLFDKDQILVVRSEDLFENFGKTYQVITRFLELPDYPLEGGSHLRHSGYTKTMEPDTRLILKEFYKPYNEELYDLLGRDMGWK